VPDSDVIKNPHAVGAVYDAAVITKDADGKVHVNRDEVAPRHGRPESGEMRGERDQCQRQGSRQGDQRSRQERELSRRPL
jgi:hypothetical protein